MTLLYDWLKKAAKAQGNNKAVVYRDNYLSWRGLLHRVDRRAQEFKSMGIKEGAWSNEEEMFALVHEMRARVITSPSFTGERIIAAILFENTMTRK